MGKLYTILPGHVFDMGGGVTKQAGEQIELDDDVAAAHAHRVSASIDAVQTPASADGDDAAGA